MSGPEIHDYSIESGAIYTPSTSGAPPVEHKQTGYSGASQIEQSKDVVVPPPPSAENPQLMSYNQDSAALFMQLPLIDATKLLMEQKLRMSEIMSSMLDKWNESIREEEERVRDLLNSPLYRQMMEIQNKGHDSTVTDSLKVEQPMIVNVTDRLNDYLSRVETASGTSQNISAAPAIASVAVLGPVMITTANPAAFASPNSPLASMTQVSTSMQQLVPPPVDISSALDVNLMVPLMQISWEVALDKTKTKPSELECATKFAQEVIQMTTSPNWMQLSVISHISGADQLSPKGKEELAAVLKLTMALVALAYLYKAETGGITSQEIMDRVKGMLAGTIPLKEGSEEATLVLIMKSQLQLLDPATKEKALLAMMAAVDNPSFIGNLDKMSDPLKAFENVFENLTFTPKDTDSDRV